MGRRRKIGNKNKLILTEIFLSVHEAWYLKVLITVLYLKKLNLSLAAPKGTTPVNYTSVTDW